MGARQSAADEAARKARYQLAEVVRTLRARRLMRGLSHSVVAASIGRSRQLIAKWERGALVPGLVDLVIWGAVLGIDIPIRSFDAGSPLRDAGQLRLLARARRLIGRLWRWRTEVPVAADRRDRRAVDAVISGPAGNIGLEAITRLTDAQAQVRSALVKQEALGLDRMVLVLSDTRHNRIAVRDSAATLQPAFPLGSRELLRAIRDGRLPAANGVMII